MSWAWTDGGRSLPGGGGPSAAASLGRVMLQGYSARSWHPQSCIHYHNLEPYDMAVNTLAIL